MDDVEVLLGDRVIERFAELEVELREGDEAVLEPLVDLLAEVEELVPAETSKLERALEAVARARPSLRTAQRGTSRDAGARRRAVPVGAADAAAGSAPPTTDRRRRRPSPRRADATSSADAVAAAGRPSRRGSSSRRRPASWPTTTSPRPAARSSGSTSPG